MIVIVTYSRVVGRADVDGCCERCSATTSCTRLRRRRSVGGAEEANCAAAAAAAVESSTASSCTTTATRNRTSSSGNRLAAKSFPPETAQIPLSLRLLYGAAAAAAVTPNRWRRARSVRTNIISSTIVIITTS